MVSDADPKGSVLYKRLTTEPKRMPLGEAQLPDPDLQAIVTWMSEGSPDFDSPPAPTFVPVSYKDEVKWISDDISKFDYYEARYMRYISLAEVWNLNEINRFKKVKWAVDKLVNSISFNPHLTPTVGIDPAGVIRRVDLRDYDLKSHDWDVTLLADYPYAIAFTYPEEFDGYEVNIRQKTGSPRAFVRADWFVNTVSQPPLYYDLLHLPHTLQELEHLLRVDEYTDYHNQNLKRALIRHSGVAHYNRVIDQRELNYWVQGVKIPSLYTITYDVADLHDVFKNFFSFPFGPRELSKLYQGKGDAWYEANKLFKHDAGEVVFGLPNGLSAYYLADKNGKRQNEVPTTIAADRKNMAPHLGSTPEAIVNGVSCMGCHAAGLNPYTDQGKAHVAQTAGFSKKQVDDYLEIASTQSEHQKGWQDYNAVYKTATEVLIKDPIVLDPSHEPVFYAAKYYEDYLTGAKLAQELKVSEADLESCLLHSPDLARVLSITNFKTDFVSRSVIEKNFDFILYTCNIGRQIKYGHVTPPKKCYSQFQNASGYTVRFSVQGASHQFNHNGNLQFQYDADEVVSNVSFWCRNKWCSYADKWTANACKNWIFKWDGARVRLYQN
jgi:hypothetical protein